MQRHGAFRQRQHPQFMAIGNQIIVLDLSKKIFEIITSIIAGIIKLRRVRKTAIRLTS
jgi:hypothetical protein